MSPEQASAEPGLDGRTDQYSLACVLYEMLTGEPPFAGSGARATMARHAIETPAPIRSRRPTVPLAIDRAVLRALAKAPADRFPDMAEFSAALVNPVSGRRSRRCPVASSRAIAVLPLVNASADPDNEYFSDGMTDELITALAKVEGLHVASRTSVFALKGVRDDVRALGARLNVSAVLEGSVRRSGNRLRIAVQLTSVADGRTLWSERYDREMADIFAIQDEIAKTIVSTLRSTLLGDLGDPVPMRYTANLKAYNLYLKGRFWWNRRTQEAHRRGHSLFRAGHRRRRRLRTGLHRARRLVRPPAGLSRRARSGGNGAGQDRGPARARAGRESGRGPHLTRMGDFHLRLGLGWGRAIVRARASSSIRATRSRGNGIRGS